MSVKNDPSAESYFRVRVTFNEKTMTIVRMRDDSEDYIQILADLGTHGDNKMLEQFNDDEINQCIWSIRLELARAQVGYSGLVNPPNKFLIFRRVPIHHNLTEFMFISMLGSVEAAMNLAALMLVNAKTQAERRQLPVAVPPVRQHQQLTSDTPTLEPPVA
jgi:hypothetical protein